MLKVALSLVKDHGPVVSILVLLMIVSFFTLNAAIDKKADRVEVAQLKESIDQTLGELRGLSRYLTGKDSFNGDGKELRKYPPIQYLVNQDFSTIPKEGYDSCKMGFIVDTSMKRNPWYCYACDSNEVSIKEFR